LCLSCFLPSAKSWGGLAFRISLPICNVPRILEGETNAGEEGKGLDCTGFVDGLRFGPVLDRFPSLVNHSAKSSCLASVPNSLPTDPTFPSYGWISSQYGNSNFGASNPHLMAPDGHLLLDICCPWGKNATKGLVWGIREHGGLLEAGCISLWSMVGLGHLPSGAVMTVHCPGLWRMGNPGYSCTQPASLVPGVGTSE
jgi:hypothetical protein